MLANLSKTVLNLLWLVGLLLFLLVCSLSYHWSSLPNLSEILSFALSLSSLILAIIAIVQNLVSGDGFSRVLSDIRSASENMLQTSSDLRENSMSFSDRTQIIEDLPDKISVMLEKISPQKAQPVETPASVKPPTAGDAPTMDSPIKGALSNGSVIALYAALCSWQTSKPFSGVEIYGQGIGLFQDGLIAGYGVSGLLEVEFKDKKYQIKSLGRMTASHILAIVDMYSRNGGEYTDYIKGEVEKVRKFFSPPTSTVKPPAAT